MNDIKYVRNSYSTNGTAFIDTTLEATLKHCLTLPKDGKKGNYGSIFIYDSKQLGVHENDEKSTGIILIDIDYINKETADTIYDNFELLHSYWPSLLAIQFSSSYYINPNKNGLHVYVKSHLLTYDEYKQQSQICYAIFAQLVFKYLQIDLTEDERSLDFHNTNLYQRLNLFYSTFKYSDYTVEFDTNQIKFDDLEKLVVKYNLSLDTTITKTISPTLNNICPNIKKSGKIKIDRNLKIGNYTGNDIRFRICIIADKLFNDNAKSFCDRYFYYENNKSIYTHYPAGNVINPLIYKWLVDNEYLVESSANYIENWLDEYSKDIVSEIQKNKILEINAPTGSGKTTFVNNYLAHQFNSVVIVPFNVTNKLYDHLFEVNSLYTKNVPKNKPVVMVWDQAIKHWDEIKDRHIIIDEAHTLFFDRTYRDSAINLIIKLREDNCWATFITATPAGEQNLFNMKQLRYYKKRSEIKLNIKATENIEWAQYNYIKKALDNNWYDRIVLLDNISAKKIYEQFIINCYGNDISYIRSSTKETKDFIELRDSELLTKRLTICTCVAFNGLNFKNENEKILVVGSIQQGITTSCEIIQQVGRIRNSQVTALYFYNPNKSYVEDIDNKEKSAKEYDEIYRMGCCDTFLNYDKKYINEKYTKALKEIQEYQTIHSNIDTIINELGMCGYIKGTVEDKIKNDVGNIRMTLALKRHESKEMKKDILENEFMYKEYDKEYQKKWSRDIRYLITNPYYYGISIETFIELFNKEKKDKLIETTIDNINKIIRYVSISDSEYNNVMKNQNLYKSMLSNEIDKIKFAKNIKKIREIRTKYKDKIKINEHGHLDLNEIINNVIDWEAEKQEKIRKQNSEKGKKGKKRILDTSTGIEYESVKECAQAIGCNRSYISKHKERFEPIA